MTPNTSCCRRLSIPLGDCHTFTLPLLSSGQVSPINSCCKRLSIPLGDCHTFTSPLLSFGQVTPIKSCCWRLSIPLGECHTFTSSLLSSGPMKSCCRRLSIPLGDFHTLTSPLLSSIERFAKKMRYAVSLPIDMLHSNCPISFEQVGALLWQIGVFVHSKVLFVAVHIFLL